MEIAGASTQYLFDKHRTSRMKHCIGDTLPHCIWRFKTRGYPERAPESTAVFDIEGNIYFGCHDGCFYSLNSEGVLRWMYSTDKKIYASPSLAGDQVIIAGGDGYLYSFSRCGDVKWIYDISEGYRGHSAKVILNRIMTIPKTFDYSRKQIWDIKCWASPYVREGVAYISGYGKGLHAVNIETGKKIWDVDLGSPRFHLSGVVETASGNLCVCAQRKRVMCISRDGEVIWNVDIPGGFDIWGNPTFDPERRLIYIIASKREKESIVFAITEDGRTRWKKPLGTAVRGAAAVSREEYIVVAGFDGCIYFLSRDRGEVLFQERFSRAIRALWTTASIDSEGNVLFTTKDSFETGSLIALDKTGKMMWRKTDVGKALSTPVVDSQGKVYIGSWTGEYICFGTR